MVEMENTKSKIMYKVGSFGIRLSMTQERIREHEDWLIETIQLKPKKTEN